MMFEILPLRLRIKILVSKYFEISRDAPRDTGIRRATQALSPDISYLFEMSGGRQNGDSEKWTEIPEEVARSLRTCGGIEGIMESLPPEAELDRISAVHRACADPIRLKILFMLRIRPLCVCVIKAALHIADSKLSYHLGVLRKAGMIRGEQQGTWIIYSLTGAGRAYCERTRYP